MQQSKCNTLALLSVPVGGRASANQAQGATPIYKAGDVPLRVVIRNISSNGLNVLISYDNQSLQQNPLPVMPAGTFTLPPGVSEIFPLMPGESLYGASPNLAQDGLISYIVSVAFPFEVKAV